MGAATAMAGVLLILLLLGVYSTGDASADSSCGAANEIVCENQKPGTSSSVWDVDGEGDPSIQGFATDMSVDAGQTVRFKVKTDAAAYRLDVYRLGWYGGAGARKVTTLTPSATLPQVQPTCLSDAATGLVDCGNWAESASWAVPADAVSGIYFAHLVRTDTGGSSHVIFVVRNDDGGSDLLLQTADTTWQAYNQYGGNSLYTGSPAGRAYKVSYNRPFTTRDYANPSFLFSAELPLVRFLERNGYDVSYFTGVDSDRYGAELLEHRVFLSVGHDEYWSGTQRGNVEAARAAGVNLAFLSGNEVFWKTRWESSIDGSGTPHRTLVSYKETKPGAKIDPSPEWTGTWMDPRLSPPSDGGRPQNALTGTLFTVNAYREDAMTIPERYGKLRFWRNTSVATLAPGTVATIAPGILGHEWNEDVDNGFRPPGAFPISETTLDVDKHLADYGNTYVPGRATHQAVLYRHASGALVFGAGTVQWTWALDGDHDTFAGDAMAPDARIQQATVNVLADMLVQPGSLQSGLVAAAASTDAQRPQSTITSPADGTEVAGGSSITVTGTASDGGGGLVAGVEVSTDGGASWHPATGRTSWSYTWTVGGFGASAVKVRAVDDSGNLEVPGPGITVQTSCPCTIWAPTATPVVAATSDVKAVELGVKFRADVNGYVTGVRFFKGAGNSGTHTGSLWGTDGTLLARATFTGESASGWQQVSFDSPVAVTADTTYIASYFAPAGHYALTFGGFQQAVVNAPLRALGDGAAAGNGVFKYAGAATFPDQTNGASNYWVDPVFDTELRPDSTPPTITDRSPLPGASGTDNRGDVVATFSEAMSPATVSASSFLLVDAGGTVVPATVVWNALSRSAVLTPNVALVAGATYTATVRGGSGGVADTAGNPLLANSSWTFATAPPRTCPCSLWNDLRTPALAASSDAKAVEIGVKFTVDEPGWINGVRFYKGPGNAGTHTGSLWTGSGTLLARAVFTVESASGWQQVSFDDPVPVARDTTYVASYHAPTGRYALDLSYFSTVYANAPLRALRDGAQGGNGVFRYGSAPSFPNQTHLSSNYWVDPVFDTQLRPDTVAPQVASMTPAAGATGVDTRGDVSAAFSEALDPASVSGSTFELRADGGALVPASVVWNGSQRRAVLTPASALDFATVYTATVRGGSAGVRDRAGNPLQADVSWSFSSATPRACPCSLWLPSAQPALASSTDAKAVEVGVKFTADAPGVVSGIRFYKGALNTGTHVGSLWTAAGALLARATFTAESGSGWQQVTFASPVSIARDTTYVASYYAPVGRYSLDLGYFGSGWANPPLRALRDGLQGGNGVFRYGAAPTFPNQTNAASNYWVDVVYSPQTSLALTAGTALQPDGTTPVASDSGGFLALDLGTVLSPRSFADAARVTNLGESAATVTLRNVEVPQLGSATFTSTGTATVVLAAGATESVTLTTSGLVAGRGQGSLLVDDGSETPAPLPITLAQAPEPPTGLAATPIAAGAVALSWSPSQTSSGLGGYHVYRSAGGAPAERMTTVAVQGLSYTDTATADGTSYRYSLRAVSSDEIALEGLASSSADATSDATPPAAPASVSLVGGGFVNAANASGASVSVTLPATTLAADSLVVSLAGGGTAVTRSISAPESGGTVVVSGFDASAIPDGPVSLDASLVDAVGNASTAASAAIVKDTVAPASASAVALANGQGAGGAYINAAVASSVAVSLELPSGTTAADTIAISLRNGPASVGKSVAAPAGGGPVTVSGIDATSLDDGTIAISAVVRDEAGNASDAALGSAPKSTTLPAAPTGISLANGAGAGNAYVNSQVAGSVSVSVAVPASPLADALVVTISNGAASVVKTVTAPAAGGTVSVTGIDTRSLPDGTVTIRATLRDTAGNTSGAGSATAPKDTSAPAQPTAVALANGGGTGNAYINAAVAPSVNVNVSVGASSLASDTVTATLSGGSTSVSKTTAARAGAGTVGVTAIVGTTLPNGTVTMAATARDLAGNTSAARTGTVTKDTVAPAQPTAVALANGGGTGNAYINATVAPSVNVNVSVGSTALAADTITVTLTGGTTTVSSAVAGRAGAGTVAVTAINATTLPNGTVTIGATARDLAGNGSAVRTATVTKDTVAPGQPTAVALANGGGAGNAYINAANASSVNVNVTVPSSAVTANSIVVTLTSGSTSASKTVASRSGAGTVAVNAINASALTNGTVTIAAVARDVAGNNSAARTTTVTKDTVAPGQPTATYVDRAGIADQITGTAAAGSTVRATRTAPSAAGPYTTTASSTGSYTVTVALNAFVTVTYNVTATDAAGNTGPARTISFATRR